MNDGNEFKNSKLDEHSNVSELWPEKADSVTNFVDRLGPADMSLEEMIGGEVLKKTDSLQVPLVMSYVDNVRQTTYRKAEGMVAVTGQTPEGSMWVDLNPRTSLRKALSLYGERLLAFEKIHRESSLEILVLPFRKKSEMTLRILVRTN